MSYINTKRIEKELIARDLVPEGCQLLEVRIEPGAALVVRYEVRVSADRLDLFADALKAAACEHLADDERNRVALKGDAA